MWQEPWLMSAIRTSFFLSIPKTSVRTDAPGSNSANRSARARCFDMAPTLSLCACYRLQRLLSESLSAAAALRPLQALALVLHLLRRWRCVAQIENLLPLPRADRNAPSGPAATLSCISPARRRSSAVARLKPCDLLRDRTNQASRIAARIDACDSFAGQYPEIRPCASRHRTPSFARV